MLCEIVVDQIVGNVYEIKDKLKELKCKWNSKTKSWDLTKETDLVGVGTALEELNKKNKIKIVDTWAVALKFHDIKFVKKNEPDYDKVYETFRKLLSKK